LGVAARRAEVGHIAGCVNVLDDVDEDVIWEASQIRWWCIHGVEFIVGCSSSALAIGVFLISVPRKRLDTARLSSRLYG